MDFLTVHARFRLQALDCPFIPLVRLYDSLDGTAIRQQRERLRDLLVGLVRSIERRTLRFRERFPTHVTTVTTFFITVNADVAFSDLTTLA